MTVFKYFLRIAWQHRIIVFLYMTMFVVMTILVGGNTSNQSFQITELKIAVSVPQSSPLSEGFVEYLSANNQVERVEWTEVEMREKVFTGLVDAAIILPEDVEAMIEQEQSQVKIFVNTQNMVAQLVTPSVNQYFTYANAMWKSNGSVDITRLNNILSSEAKVTITGKQNSNSNGLTQWASFYFKFSGYILIVVLINLLGLLLLDFEEENVAMRQKLGAMSLIKINRDKFMGSAILTSMILLLLIIIALIIKPSLWQYVTFYEHIGVTVVMGFAALALAYLCATTVGVNRTIFSGLSVVIGLGLSFISGVFAPLEVLSESVVTVAKFFPLYYAVRAHEAIYSGDTYWQYVGVLFLFIVTYFVLAMTVSRIRQTR